MAWIDRRAFESLLVLGAAAETLHLVGLFDRRTDVDGTGLALAFTAVVPWITPLIGLAVTRLRMAAAKWAFLLLMTVVWFNMAKLGVSEWWGDPWLTLGFTAGVAQTLAAAMLLTPTGWRWTRRDVAGR